MHTSVLIEVEGASCESDRATTAAAKNTAVVRVSVYDVLQTLVAARVTAATPSSANRVPAPPDASLLGAYDPR